MYGHESLAVKPLIDEMNSSYKDIKSEIYKKIVSEIVEEKRRKYLNKESKENNRNLVEIITTVFDLCRENIDRVQGLTKNECKIKLYKSIKKQVSENNITKYEADIIKKIFSYQACAKYLERECSDYKTYEKLRKNSVKISAEIKNTEGINLLLKYIDKDFLNYKN